VSEEAVPERLGVGISVVEDEPGGKMTRIEFSKQEKAPLWCQKNIQRMMGMILRDKRMGRPVPLEVRMSKEALDYFKSFLKSEAYYFDPLLPKIDFMGVSVFYSEKLPPFTFATTRLSDQAAKLVIRK
jgi:hypothetical protein